MPGHPLQLAVVVIGAIVSAIAYVLMRKPGLRREPFQGLAPTSRRTAAVGALLLFALFVAIASIPPRSNRVPGAATAPVPSR